MDIINFWANKKYEGKFYYMYVNYNYLYLCFWTKVEVQCFQ